MGLKQKTMNIKEVINNIDIVCKPMDNRTDLTPVQQHAKDTLHASRLTIAKLSQIIEEKDEHLRINYGAYTKQAIDLKREQKKVIDLESRIKVLMQDIKDLKHQNEEFKKNLKL